MQTYKVSCDNREDYCKKNYNPFTTTVSLKNIIEKGSKETMRYKDKGYQLLELMIEHGAINPVVLPL